jgi:hypothetical protein
VAGPDIGRSSRAGGMPAGVGVLLVHTGDHDVGSEERDHFHVVTYGGVLERAGQHLSRKVTDLLSSDKPPTTAGNPERVRLEQGEEAIHIFGQLSALQFRDAAKKGLNVRRVGAVWKDLLRMVHGSPFRCSGLLGTEAVRLRR